MIEIFYHPRFRKVYSRLPLGVKMKAEQKERIFRADPHSASLKTHKLHGKLDKFWSFSIDRKYRILFEFAGKNEVIFLDIGTHEVYK